MDNLINAYGEEATPANEIRGFTKSFVKRTKDKKREDENVRELLSFQRDGKVVFGEKVSEKLFKKNSVKKVYLASNCKEITEKKFRHYGKILGVDVVKLDLDNSELSQKLEKPFLISVVSVRSD